MKILAVIAAMMPALLLCGEASAQRHVAGQHALSFEGMAYRQYGVGASWGRCGHYGRSVFGLGYLAGPAEPYTVIVKREIMNEEGRTEKFDDYITYDLKMQDILASGGYMFRVAGSRSRTVSLWLGGTVDFGVRIYRKEGLSGDGLDQIPPAKFIYGISPRMEVEYFPYRAVSFSFHVRPRIQLYGHKKFDNVFYPEVGLGCTFYLMD